MNARSQHATLQSSRRTFLQRLSGAGVLAALPGCAASLGAARVHASDDPRDSWTSRVSAATHRMVFDAAEIGAGAVFSNAASYLAGIRSDASPAAVITPVLVLRHAAVVLAFDDAAWARYAIGKRFKLNEPGSTEEVRRNPFYAIRPGQVGGPLESNETIEALTPSVIFLACDSALTSFAKMFASALKLETDAVAADLRAHLIPGAILQPTGILAVARAQQAGCFYMRSS